MKLKEGNTTAEAVKMAVSLGHFKATRAVEFRRSHRPAGLPDWSVQPYSIHHPTGKQDPFPQYQRGL